MIKARMLHRLEKICAIYGEDTLSKSAARIVRSLSCWKFGWM